MMQANYNERSWAIDLISNINVWLNGRSIYIKRAGGEHTLKTESGTLFPDVLLFGDEHSGEILQGWELKMPDTPINDRQLLENAQKKAQVLGLESFLVWNVSTAVLYKVNDSKLEVLKTWNDLEYIKSREQVVNELDAIYKQLQVILEDLSSLFGSGNIRTTSIDDALTGEGMTGVILRNVSSYASGLQKLSEANYDLEDEVNLWWLSSKMDFPGENNKWEVLAKNNLVTTFNKFIFAHALRHYNSAANVVDTLVDGTTLEHGLKKFEEISTKADFWNIFSINLGEDQLPESIWKQFISLNAVLKDIKLKELDASVIHEILEKLTLRTKRKVAGQFATPYPLAKLLTTLVVLDPSKEILDPCCGTGTIAKAVYDHKIGKNVNNPLSTTWASDRYALPLKMTTLTLARPEEIGNIQNVFQKDATNLKTGLPIQLHDPYDGQSVVKKLPSFGYILSNLPFVQQEFLAKLNPQIDAINEDIVKYTRRPNLALDKRGDLFTYLPFYFWSLLEDNGKLGIIISNSWLATEMGDKFFQALRHFYSVEAVITSGAGKWFDNADVIANILVLKKNPDPSHALAGITKFMVLNKTLDNIYNEGIEFELRAMLNSKTTNSSPIASIEMYLDEDFNTFNELQLPRSAFFADLTWLKSIKEITLPANNLFYINRGERRGWDKLFFPPIDSGIEEEYLKPVLKTPQSIKKPIAVADGLAFCCDVSKEELKTRGHSGALNWIESFEHLKNGNESPLPEVLARSGTNWYTMKPDTMADIVTAINFGDRLFYGKFREPTFVNQRLVRFTRKTPSIDTDLVHALLNSIIGIFYLEALGFGRGQGALDLNTTKLMKSLRVLNPDLLNRTQKRNIIDLFDPIKNRDIKPLTSELEDPDRILFDKKVLSIYKQDDIYDDIKSSLLKLYKIRTSIN